MVYLLKIGGSFHGKLLSNQRVTCINHPFLGLPNFDHQKWDFCSACDTGLTGKYLKVTTPNASRQRITAQWLTWRHSTRRMCPGANSRPLRTDPRRKIRCEPLLISLNTHSHHSPWLIHWGIGKSDCPISFFCLFVGLFLQFGRFLMVSVWVGLVKF